ncbi:hypothetical protein ACFFVB_02300 [Formosa undariae]|uniref:Uncharacterized protein n=1 Tax=Formosa undariae TaxID=1325436 RepID=A0ABV5EXI6_9FLAO
MKRAMTLSICLLVTITSLASSFTSNMSSNFDDKENKEVTLTLEDVKVGQNLSIKDIDGFTLYTKTLKKSGSSNHTFDFSTLPNGTYFFEHDKSNQIKVIPFEVKFGNVTFDASREKIIYKPVVRLVNNYVYLSKLELAKEDVDVAIYYDIDGNQNYNVVHKQTIKDTSNIQCAFKLSVKESGNYRMVIKANGREYVEYFSL